MSYCGFLPERFQFNTDKSAANGFTLKRRAMEILIYKIRPALNDMLSFRAARRTAVEWKLRKRTLVPIWRIILSALAWDKWLGISTLLTLPVFVPVLSFCVPSLAPPVACGAFLRVLLCGYPFWFFRVSSLPASPTWDTSGLLWCSSRFQHSSPLNPLFVYTIIPHNCLNYIIWCLYDLYLWGLPSSDNFWLL